MQILCFVSEDELMALFDGFLCNSSRFCWIVNCSAHCSLLAVLNLVLILGFKGMTLLL